VVTLKPQQTRLPEGIPHIGHTHCVYPSRRETVGWGSIDEKLIDFAEMS